MNALTPQTEMTVGRAPVQVAEILTQRCANEFGCAPCRAGLGSVDSSELSINFAQQGLGPDYAVSNGTGTRVAGGVRVEASSADCQLSASGVTTGFSGDDFRYVVIDLTVDVLPATPEWFLFYENAAGATFSVNTRMTPVNRDVPFRGIADIDDISAGQRLTLVFDAADSTNYATDWQGDTIDGLRFDLGVEDTADYTIHSITVCSESLFAAKGSECYRTRATCQDLASYRALIDGHLVPTSTLRDEDDIVASNFTTDGPAFFVADVRAGTTPTGTILAFGSATNFIYLGVTGANLVLAAGGDGATDQARATVAATTIAGRSLTLVAEVDYDADTVNLWEFDPVSRALTLLATDAADTALPAAWAAATDGQVGTDGGNTYGTEDGLDWNGSITEVRGHDAIFFDGRAGEEFSLIQYFGLDQPRDQPADDVRVLPYLRSVSTAPTKVSLGGANRDTDPLGNRASVTLRMTDQKSSDLSDDPYITDRLFDPLNQPGSFWSKWRVRQKFGRVGARLRIYEGFRGQRLSQMMTREYLLDRLDLNSREEITIRGRDILSRAELSKAQVPVQSPGLLATALAATGETIIQISGAVLDDYPVPGTVRIDKELITYDAAAINGTDPSLIDLTIDARGSDNSVPAEHSTDDSVQLCRRFTNRSVSSILTELLGDDAAIPGQFLDIANWEAEDTSFLSAYVFSTVITEPTSVAKLVGGLVESAASFVYWDERQQLVRLEALKSLSSFPDTLTDDVNVIADTFSLVEKPKEQATRVQVYYNPINFAERFDDPADFLNGYIDANTDLEDDDAYGRRQTRTILSRWINTNAQATQTASRLAGRYQDVPVEITFAMDAKNRDYWIGSQFFMSHYQLTDSFGDRDTQRLFIITSAEEIVPGHIVKYTAEDTTLAGFIFVITPNSQGDYTGDPDTDGLYAFISDNFGNYSDGTPGARVS